jgi:ribosomal protein S17E
LHADHAGSLPTLLPYYQYRLNLPAPKIIVPNDTFKTELQDYLTCTKESERATYVPISDFPDIGWIDTTNQHVPDMTSFAYYFTEADELIYYSGDIANADTAKDFLATRQESKITVFHETSPEITTVHTHYKEVQDKLAGYTTYLYHIAKENMPADCSLPLVEETPELLV